MRGRKTERRETGDTDLHFEVKKIEFEHSCADEIYDRSDRMTQNAEMF